jgi:hypothetical protein
VNRIPPQYAKFFAAFNIRDVSISFMMASSNIHGETLEAVFEESTEELGDDIIVGYPDESLVIALARILEAGMNRQVRILMGPASVQSMSDNFFTLSKLSELSAKGFDIRLSSSAQSPGVTDGDQVVVPVDTPDRAVGFVDSDEEFVESLTTAYENSWSRSTPYDPDVPPLSTLLERLATNTSEELAADFESVLSAKDSLGAWNDGVSVVSLSLLLAARHEALLYDLSEWGERTGLASKATFSRTKIQLEEENLINTQSVPIDVGRPRLKLLLNEQELESADPESVVEIARRRLN